MGRKIIGITVGTTMSPERVAEKMKVDEKMRQAVEIALEQAKTSGEFDGKDGKTPVKGTDYWTEADKAEIKSYVDEAILGGAW